MEQTLESVIVAGAALTALISLVGTVWGFIDSIVTPNSRFKAAGRNKALWILGSLLISFVGVYYVCIVRRELKGQTFPRWLGYAALWLGAILAVGVVVSAAAGVAANFAVASGVAVAILVYLGLHPEDWTGKATPVA